MLEHVGSETERNESTYRTASVLIVGYFLIQVLANLTVAKSVSLWRDTLIIPFGSLLYAVSFTWIDLVNDRFGKRRARWLVAVVVAANVLFIIWLQLYIRVPGSEAWRTAPEHQQAIEFVFGGIPRIYAASLITNLIAENVDITAFHFLKDRVPRVPRWGRSLVSNLVSAPTDGAVFAVLAFAGTLPSLTLAKIAATSAAYKLVIAACSVPLIYTVQARRSNPVEVH